MQNQAHHNRAMIPDPKHAGVQWMITQSMLKYRNLCGSDANTNTSIPKMFCSWTNVSEHWKYFCWMWLYINYLARYQANQHLQLIPWFCDVLDDQPDLRRFELQAERNLWPICQLKKVRKDYETVYLMWLSHRFFFIKSLCWSLIWFFAHLNNFISVTLRYNPTFQIWSMDMFLIIW